MVSNRKARDEGGRDENCSCDLHARQQTIAMVDLETGEFSEKTLAHEGNMVREFYAGLDGPVVVGIEATGAMQWFLELLEELGIECRVGHPAKIRSVESGWAKSPPGFAPGSVHQSKAKPTAELVQPIAEAGPGAGPAGGRTSPATTPGAAPADGKLPASKRSRRENLHALLIPIPR